MTKNVISVGPKMEIKTPGLDKIMAMVCFVFNEPSTERDDMLRSEIEAHTRPLINDWMAASDLYAKLAGEATKEAFRKRAFKALAKRYVHLFHGAP